MIRPMLGKEVDLNKLQYPVYTSPKMDGVRALIVDGKVMSRTGKPIRNKYVQALFGKPEYEGFDGELIVGKPYDSNVYQKTVSGVMSEEGAPDVHYYIFDLWNEPNRDFVSRSIELRRKYDYTMISAYNAHLHFTDELYTADYKALITFEQHFLKQGYEGVMIRNPNALYKNGRSTIKSGELLKLKRFKDSEAIILGILPKFHNTNEATKDALGHTTRSSAMSGMIAEPLMGALSVEDIHTGIEFEIGSGFNDATRKDIWENKDCYLGEMVKYKYFPIGEKDKPRFPIFLGFRDKDDI